MNIKIADNRSPITDKHLVSYSRDNIVLALLSFFGGIASAINLYYGLSPNPLGILYIISGVLFMMSVMHFNSAIIFRSKFEKAKNLFQRPIKNKVIEKFMTLSPYDMNKTINACYTRTLWFSAIAAIMIFLVYNNIMISIMSTLLWIVLLLLMCFAALNLFRGIEYYRYYVYRQYKPSISEDETERIEEG